MRKNNEVSPGGEGGSLLPRQFNGSPKERTGNPSMIFMKGNEDKFITSTEPKRQAAGSAAHLGMKSDWVGLT
jgi:hypothetical protein